MPSIAKPMAMSVPALEATVRRAACVAFEAEAARLILDAKHLRSADGAWQSAVAPMGSAVCPGKSWTFVTGPPSRIVFGVHEALPAEFIGAKLPNEFVFE